MAHDTSFGMWRRRVGLTQDEAAGALGVSKSQIANWEAGTERTRGRPAVPPYAIRCLMTLLAMDSVPTPWPE